MVIGITGSSGAGKSTVCEILENEYQAKIISADKVAKELSKKGTKYLEDIIEKFGTGILLENGELNRKKLAEIIYTDKEKRKQLNQCTFKYIFKEIEREIQNSSQNLIAIDAPLLFEANLEKICDTTIAVVSENREMQISRIMERDNIDRQHALSRLGAQHPNVFYKNKCNYVIENDKEILDIHGQIKVIFKSITNKN